MKNLDQESLEWRDYEQEALKNGIAKQTGYSRLSKFTAFLLSVNSGVYLSTSTVEVSEYSGLASNSKMFLALGISYASLAISSYFTSEYFNDKRQDLEQKLAGYEAESPLIPPSVMGNANATNTVI